VKRPQPAPDWPASWVESYAFDLQEVYGDVSNFGYAYAYRNRRDATLGLLQEVLEPGARILDVAAAQGNFSLALAESGYHVTWNDLRAELEGYVRLKHERGALEFRPGNMFELRPDAPYDAVLITEVIEHVAHPDQFLERAAALVRPGGYVVMTTPNGRYFRNKLPKFSACEDASHFEAIQFRPNSDGHIFLLHPSEIRQLASRAGLEIDALRLFTNSLTSGHMKTAPALRMIPEGVVQRLERLSRRLPERVRERCLVHIAARLRKTP
jgi:2-polyprenyl-3-methyl-5-hydroxy-6-metoxy-1,4-benzoquinol methylase